MPCRRPASRYGGRQRPPASFLLNTEGRRVPCQKCGNHIINGTSCATTPPTCSRPPRTATRRTRPARPIDDTNLDPLASKILSIDNQLINDSYIWDTGSANHFAPREELVPNTFVADQRKFGSASGHQFVSPGYGDLILHLQTTTGGTCAIHLTRVYVAHGLRVIGSRLEHET